MSARVKTSLMVVLMFAAINLPVLHSAWLDRQLAADGVDTTATVTEDRVLQDDEPKYFLEFTFPEELDPDQALWTAQVDESTYDDALAAGRLGVRVLPDRPSVYEVEGQVRSSLGLVITIVADLILAAMVLLLYLFRGRLRPELRLVALEDVQRAKPGSELDRLTGETYVVVGEVCSIDVDQIVLDVAGRKVRVDLDGHHNPVGYQQPARVTGRMVG